MSSTVNTNAPSTTAAPGNAPSPAQAQAQAIAFNAANLVKNKANYYLTRLDKELAKSQYANDIEKRTGVPKSYLVVGISTFIFAMIFMDFGAKLLTNVLSWIYPAYASFKAIESTSTEDDTQWLTYWTVIGFAQMVEYFSDILLFWFPFYYTFKTILVLWLILPQFRGAQVVYVRILRPFLLTHASEIDRHANKFSSNPFGTASN